MDEEITWKQLLNYHLGKPDKPLKRKKEIQDEYDKYINMLKSNGMSINKYIIGVWFSGENCEKKFLITKNKFPYNLEKSITHLLVWINPLNKASQENIIEYINNKCLPNSFVMFKNSPYKDESSVSIVSHYYLFIKDNIPDDIINKSEI